MWHPLKFRVLQCANPFLVPFAKAVLVRGPSDLPVQRNREDRMSYASWDGRGQIVAETCKNVPKRVKTASVFRSDGRQLVSDSRSLPSKISLFKNEGRQQPKEVAHIKQLLNIGAVKNWHVQEARECATHQDPIVFPLRSDADNTSVKRGCSVLYFDAVTAFFLDPVIDLVFPSSL